MSREQKVNRCLWVDDEKRGDSTDTDSESVVHTQDSPTETGQEEEEISRCHDAK